jgi:tetratricopeptide (TPR) repeat protein
VSRGQAVTRDGETIGLGSSNWGWAFARMLLARQAPHRDLPFVSSWFHATTAFLMARHLYGEAETHLASVADVLPKDAWILFDRAAYAEMSGLPESQAVLAASVPIRGMRIAIAPATRADADAERLYRAALQADASLAEARVRLARLLDLDRHVIEAETQIDLALADPNQADPVVRFYAHVIGGRIEREIGDADHARAHFAAALALYPHAQSAIIGASEAALVRADVDGALAPLRALDRPSDAAPDPWWMYQVGIGRNASALLAEMWADARGR